MSNSAHVLLKCLAQICVIYGICAGLGLGRDCCRVAAFVRVRPFGIVPTGDIVIHRGFLAAA